MKARMVIIARAIAPAVLLVAIFANLVRAQAPPPRDRVPTPPPGTAVIKGRVIDAQTGNPLARARVRLQAPGNPAPVTTDQAGAFKITAIPAGSVYLSVERNGYLGMRYPEAKKTLRASIGQLVIEEGQVLEGLTVAMSRGGAITGRVVDAHGEPAEGIQIQLFRVVASGRGRPQQRMSTSTNDLGEFRLARIEPGGYLLRAQGRSTMSWMDDVSEMQPAPVYYPGVISMEQALPITIERSQTVEGIELMLVEATSSVVSGTVLDAKGQPASPGTYISARQIADFNDVVVGGAAVRPDGTFRLKLLPGDYSLEVQATRPGVLGRSGPEDQQYGRARISVGSAPISDVTVVLGQGASMTGKAVFEGDSPLPPNPQQISIALGPPPAGIACQFQGAPINPDGTFRVQGVVGTCVVRVMGNLGRWSVKSITQGDADLRDRVLTFEPGQQLRGVQVVFTDKQTALNVTVNDNRGQPTRDYVAIAFSTDKTKWNEMSPYVRLLIPGPQRGSEPTTPLRGSVDVRAAPTSERRDSIVNIPPGDYYVVAVSDIAADDSRDPAVLERLAAGATRLTVSYERSPVEVTLRRTDLR
jgi:Carboxypeptidase regulatory-like domain